MKPVRVTMEELGAMYCAGGRNMKTTKESKQLAETSQKADNDKMKHRALTHGIKGYGTHS